MSTFRKYPLEPLAQAVWPSALKAPEGATHFLETANHASFRGAGLDHEGVPYVAAVEGVPYVAAVEDERQTLRQRVFLQVVESGEETGEQLHGAAYVGHFHAPEEPNTYGVFVLAVYGPEWLRPDYTWRDAKGASPATDGVLPEEAIRAARGG